MTMFNIIQDSEEIISLSGRFDASQVEKAEKVFNSIEKSCVVDMKNLNYISSAGLGIMLRTYSRLKPNGYDIKLKNLNYHIREVLKYSGLDKIFIIEE